jgi:hypothetical protein
MANNYLQFSAIVAHLKAEEEAWLKSQLEWIGVHAEKETAIDGPDDEAAEDAEWFGPRFLRDNREYDPACESLGFEYAFHDDHDTPDGWGRHLWLYAEETGEPYHAAWLIRKFLQAWRPSQCWSLTYATTCSKPRAGEFGGGAVFVTANEIRCQNAYEFVEQQHAAFKQNGSPRQEETEHGETTASEP